MWWVAEHPFAWEVSSLSARGTRSNDDTLHSHARTHTQISYSLFIRQQGTQVPLSGLWRHRWHTSFLNLIGQTCLTVSCFVHLWCVCSVIYFLQNWSSCFEVSNSKSCCFVNSCVPGQERTSTFKPTDVLTCFHSSGGELGCTFWNMILSLI